MANTNIRRTTSILIKVTSQEKEEIAKNAASFGGSISEFIRHQSLHPNDGSANGAQTQAIVRELCCLHELIKNSNDSQLRNKLEEWSENIWQFIR